MTTAIDTAQIKRELEQQLGNMQLASALTTIVVNEISDLHLYGIESVADTLKRAEGLIKRSYRQPALTDLQRHQVHRRTVTYLDSIAYITHRGSVQMVQLLVDHLPRR